MTTIPWIEDEHGNRWCYTHAPTSEVRKTLHVVRREDGWYWYSNMFTGSIILETTYEKGPYGTWRLAAKEASDSGAPSD